MHQIVGELMWKTSTRPNTNPSHGKKKKQYPEENVRRHVFDLIIDFRIASGMKMRGHESHREQEP